MPTPRTIAILALPGVQQLDVAGPLDVFAEANQQAEREIYRLRLLGAQSGPIVCSSGIRILPDGATTDITSNGLDTLLIAGAPHAADIHLNAATLEWLRAACANARRFGSVCSGAFFLAAAGLLDGRRITTHWAVADELARRYPSVDVDSDAIHIRDGKLCTAAGVTAGMDLSLALVEEDLGRDVAMRVASQLVMFFRRPGGQMQFRRKGQMGLAGRSTLQELQRWVIAHPAEPHDVASLAARVGLSPRHFARLFRHEVGVTPATWVEEARIAAARALLEHGQHAPKQVASRCGFADADVLRRAFARHVGITPAEYRRLHRMTPAASKPDTPAIAKAGT